jgi:hypothetical protein
VNVASVLASGRDADRPDAFAALFGSTDAQLSGQAPSDRRLCRSVTPYL